MAETSTTEDLTKQLLQRLASDATRDQLLETRTGVQQSHRTLLMETGQVQLKQSKGEAVDADRKKLLNQALNLAECYLMSLEAALSISDFLQLALNPDSPSDQVQARVPYETFVEELLHVQHLHADQLLRAEPILADLVTPSAFVTVLRPFTTLCTVRHEHRVL